MVVKSDSFASITSMLDVSRDSFFTSDIFGQIR